MTIELGIYAGSIVSVAAGAAAIGYKLAKRVSAKEAAAIYEKVKQSRDKASEKGTTISTIEAVAIIDETLDALRKK